MRKGECKGTIKGEDFCGPSKGRGQSHGGRAEAARRRGGAEGRHAVAGRHRDAITGKSKPMRGERGSTDIEGSRASDRARECDRVRESQAGRSANARQCKAIVSSTGVVRGPTGVKVASQAGWKAPVRAREES